MHTEVVSTDNGAEALPLIPLVPLVSDLHTPSLIQVYSTVFIEPVPGRAAKQNLISKHTQEAHISDILMDQIFTKECVANIWKQGNMEEFCLMKPLYFL